MTGCEMIIIKDSKGVLGKVRHDGDDAIEWLTSAGTAVFNHQDPSGVWNDYFVNTRMASMKPYNIGTTVYNPVLDQIDSKYQYTGFGFVIPSGTVTDFASLDSIANASMPKDDNFNCGYGDYCILIDMDKKTVYVNDDRIL